MDMSGIAFMLGIPLGLIAVTPFMIIVYILFQKDAEKRREQHKKEIRQLFEEDKRLRGRWK
ncbi:hypothetical protein WKH56_20330 [Priestia sp. SB1]|uniref:hypothetical protein n=1 Tax=Priestia sp. SB1 TaxID=3132359 RepID=UPI0031747FF5